MKIKERHVLYLAFYLAILGSALMLSGEPPIHQLNYQYWQDVADLKPKTEEFLDNDSCYTNKKTFLGCVNGIDRLLETEFNQELSFDGSFVTQGTASEQDSMKRWETQFSLKKIDFKKTLDKAMDSVNDKEKNYAYGQVINGFLSIYKDPHTYIMPINLFNDTINSNEDKNLGFKISKKTDGTLFFRKISKGSLFDTQGVKKGDTLIRLKGSDLDRSTLMEVYYALRNQQKFSFTVVRDNKNFNFSFPREEVKYSEVSAEFYDNYSVITVERFARNSCEKVENYLDEVKKRKIKNVVLDMRENGGGMMTTAECMANLFLKKHSLIFTSRYFDKKEESVSSENDPIYGDKLFVLVNGSSASSSELLAGALQDHHRATIVGQPTFGKGSFQEGRNWQKGLAIFETKGLFILPSGTSPQFNGVLPDVVVKSESVDEGGEDRLYYSPIKPQQSLRKTIVSKEELNYNSKDNELEAVVDIIKSQTKQAAKSSLDSI